MPFASRLFKSKHSRDSVLAGADASRHVPSSSFVSGDNSQGASQASKEVAGYMGSCFDEFDVNEDLHSNLNDIKIRLNERAYKYSNVGLPSSVGMEWKLDQSRLTLLKIAIECAANVYDDKASKISLPDLQCEIWRSVVPSLDGVTKAARFYHVKSASTVSPQPLEPTLVIAVRGTQHGSLVDWLVNLNHRAREVETYLSFADILPANQVASFKVEVHAGYLNGVKALEKEIRSQLDSCRSMSTQHVIFTGHSAGGAVASLAFMHILGQAKRDYPEFRFSLITFGCPPVTSRQLTPYLSHLMSIQSHPGMAMAVINEHDPITRADKSYIESMTDLYNVYGGSVAGSDQSSNLPWKFGPQDLHAVGELMVLKNVSLEDKADIRAYRVEPDQFGQLIFCDEAMHKKAKYMENVNELHSEESNGEQSAMDADYVAWFPKSFQIV